MYVLIRLHRATSNLHSGTWDMYPMAVPLNTHASSILDSFGCITCH